MLFYQGWILWIVERVGGKSYEPQLQHGRNVWWTCTSHHRCENRTTQSYSLCTSLPVTADSGKVINFIKKCHVFINDIRSWNCLWFFFHLAPLTPLSMMEHGEIIQYYYIMLSFMFNILEPRIPIKRRCLSHIFCEAWHRGSKVMPLYRNSNMYIYRKCYTLPS